MKPLLYVADSHLTSNDPEVDSFIRFLEVTGPGASTLYILGDLFNVWFGEARFRMPHQQRVLDALTRLAGSGVVIKFVEGNRDFSIRRNHLGAPFADVGMESLVERYDGRTILAAHGDEVNRKDRQYRLWKRVSKSFAVYGLFRMLPGSVGIGIGERLEKTLSGTNIRHKSFFPEQECRLWADEVFAGGCDTIVLGHFHEERVITSDRGTLYVLPTWRGHHRYLMFEQGAAARFVDFTG